MKRLKSAFFMRLSNLKENVSYTNLIQRKSDDKIKN